MAGYAFELGGDWQRKFTTLQNKLSGRNGASDPFWQRASVIMHREVMQNFSNESSPKGKWEPLKTGYLAKREAYAAEQASRRSSAVRKLAKRKGAEGVKILQGSGYLRGSMLFEGRNNMARVYSETIYARIHQLGSQGNPDKNGRDPNIPKREYLWISDDGMGRITGDYGRWVVLD